ncbi:MAG: hypothetical protein WB870_12990 [Gallionellaceae bacterium]
MNQKFEQLARTVTDYPQFKDQFSMFCKTIAGGLNNNDKLPGVSFSVIREGATAEIRMLDQIFVIRFYLARTPKERRVGVLGGISSVNWGRRNLAVAHILRYLWQRQKGAR